ncbi:MAG TPA: polysaccharide lyase family protein, partial [Verrucomicrobiae bacterium]|nr:polysaccharide lyase family protein [Verrucomicrobiae bacterium]
MKTIQLLLATALLAMCHLGPAATLRTLWEIGRSDNDTAEFALARTNYLEFPGLFGSPDDLYFIGHSNPKEHWPYVLPGTVDEWAGSTHWGGDRMWMLPIGFALETRPEAACRLRVDFADTSSNHPPILRVWVNEIPHDFQLPKGGGDRSIHGEPGAGKEHILAVDIPPAELQAGFNRIAVTIKQGSWVLFDAVSFAAPVEVKLAPQRNTVLRSVRATAHGIARDGAVDQILLVDIQQFGQPGAVRIEVEDCPAVTRSVEPGRTVLEVSVPAVTKPTPARVVVKSGGATLFTGSVT